MGAGVAENKKAGAKRLIVLLDGTWNDSAFSETDTNIVRLRELIAESIGMHPGVVAPENTSPEGEAQSTFQDPDNVVFYERGVGTGAYADRFLGGAFGHGLSNNIRRAYKFLSFHYEQGDQVFIFGFSRGAYTARSLIGYIESIGLLKCEHCTEELEQTAWDYYRVPPNDRMPGVWSALTNKVHARSTFRVACLGLFDTVGALGIPLSQFKVANRDKYEFHSVELSTITDVNLHALAIDEPREPFEASVWRRSKFKNTKTKTEQVWFPGAHADVGGGYIDSEKRGPAFPATLDDITLDWMIKRVLKHHKDFPAIDKCSTTESKKLSKPRLAEITKFRLDAAISTQHNPMSIFYRLFTPRAHRTIANRAQRYRALNLILLTFGNVRVGFDRHAIAYEEMIHISAIERLAETSKRWRQRYSPPNLIYLVPNILLALEGKSEQASAEKQSLAPVRVVDWEGEPIIPGTPLAKRLIEVLTPFKI